MTRAWTVLGLLVAACGSSPMSAQHVKMGELAFDAPSDWDRANFSRRGSLTTVWTPSDGNSAKESIVITRTELAPNVAAAGAPTIARLLQRAAALPGARAHEVEPYATSTGMEGARVELDFVPPNQSVRYHRVHVVLSEGTALVHVIYTAVDPDNDERALALVLNSIHREG